MQVTDERNLETIPVGPLGIIPLESWVIRSTAIWLPGAMSGSMSTRATLLSRAIRETAISSAQQPPVSVPVKPKVSSRNRSAETISTLWLTCATTT